MKTVTIYYFSGTGNSLKVAKDLHTLLPDSHLQSIPKLLQSDRIITDSEVVGIIFPVYWLGLPAIVKRFLEKVESDPRTYFFAINTFGGLNGQSIYQTYKLLQQKGMCLHAGFSIWMPGNAQSHYPPFPQFIQKIQFNRQKQKTQNIAKIISARKQIRIRKTPHIPIPLFQSIYRKFLRDVATMDKEFWTDNDCTHCRLCERICPVQNIQCTDQYVVWQGRCEFCLACMQWCPTDAIQYKKRFWGKRRYHHPDITVRDIIAQRRTA